MRNLTLIFVLTMHCFLTACSPIKMQVSNQYKLESFSSERLRNQDQKVSILVSQPESVAGYQTDQMLYIKRPFEIEAFSHNAWISSPANMLFPLITQSLQHTGYFYAVASGPYADKTDYRLDTQVIALQQNFLSKPSVIQLVAKVMVTHVSDNRIISTRMISKRIPCPTDTPYGGVIAANQAAAAFTKELSQFVVNQVIRDQDHST